MAFLKSLFVDFHVVFFVFHVFCLGLGHCVLFRLVGGVLLSLVLITVLLRVLSTLTSIRSSLWRLRYLSTRPYLLLGRIPPSSLVLPFHK